jgi:hypothetical protein
MEKVTGRLVLALSSGGEVQMLFMSNTGAGTTRPLLAKGTGQAENDLLRTFDFAPDKAKALIAELESGGQTDVVITID